jgi:hypothetical protein
MEGEMSSEEILEQCLRDMGAELGSTYAALRNEVAWIHAKWNQYRQLYAHSPERVDFINQVARHFFGVIQTSLLEDVVLHLARLTDPPKSAGKENLTIKRFTSLLSGPLASDIDALLDSAITACKPARDWRNRHLAHRDWSLVMASSTEPLAGISRKDIETALSSIRAVMNRLAKHFSDSEVAYQIFITSGGDADSLIYYLNLGMQADEQRLERLRRGEFTPEDLHPRRSV